MSERKPSFPVESAESEKISYDDDLMSMSPSP